MLPAETDSNPQVPFALLGAVSQLASQICELIAAVEGSAPSGSAAQPDAASGSSASRRNHRRDRTTLCMTSTGSDLSDLRPRAARGESCMRDCKQRTTEPLGRKTLGRLALRDASR